MDWRESMLRGRSEGVEELRGREDIGIVDVLMCWCVALVFRWRV